MCTILGGYFCFRPFLPRPLQEAKKNTRKSHGNHGCHRSLPLPPPLALWRWFQSMASVDRVMGDATFVRLHRNRAGGWEKHISHGCGGSDCGGGGNSDSNSDGDGGGDGNYCDAQAKDNMSPFWNHILGFLCVEIAKIATWKLAKKFCPGGNLNQGLAVFHPPPVSRHFIPNKDRIHMNSYARKLRSPGIWIHIF